MRRAPDDDAARATSPALPAEAQDHYAQRREAARLAQGHGPLELARTQDLLRRHLPAPPARILDVGGGPGTYAVWLQSLGYEVHLVDALELHVEQARRAGEVAGHPLASARVGDARQLAEPSGRHDAVLLMGPLYHLTEREDRITALREAHRVLRAGGRVLAVSISRFASLLAGLFDGSISDPEFGRIVEQDLRDGQHRNPTPRDYFTTAFFHHPRELRAEVRAAGFVVEALLSVEGPGWPLVDFPARWADPAWRNHLLEAARAVEREPTLLGLSAHVMAVGRARRAR